MTDVITRNGGPVVPVEELTSADQDTILGDGTAFNPLHTSGGGGGDIAIEADGAPVGTADTLNFVGLTVAVAEDGVASITANGSAVRGFYYECDGTEGNDFPVPIPLASRPTTTSYIATVTGGGLSSFLMFDAPRDDIAPTAFRLKTSAAVSAGDVLSVVITEIEE